MTIKQISVFVENKSGHLARITSLLGKNGVDLRAMSIADTTDFGILRIIVNDTEKAISILKNEGCIVSVTDVLAVEMGDTPGSLAKILTLLSDSGISIEYLYAFITRKHGHAYVILRVEDNDAAAAILAKNGISLPAPEELNI